LLLKRFQMEISDQSPSVENNPSAPTGEEELRTVNRQLQEQADQLLALNQELVDREARLRLSVETGRVGIWVWDATGSVHTLDWSRRLKEIFGLKLDTEVTRELFLQSVHPEDRERVDWAIMQSLSGVNDGFYHIEYRIIHPGDNSQHWVTAQGQAFFDASGQSIRFIGAVVDISDRKQVEEFTARLNLELERRIAERISELKKTEAALRVSEHVARGQVESLKETLNSISTELDPDKFLQHVLCIIAKQMGGQSVSVWNRDDDDSLTLAAIFEENQLHVPTQKTTCSTQDQPLWAEAFRTGTDCLLIEMSEPKRMRLINRSDSEWVPPMDNPSERAGLERLADPAVSLAIPMLRRGRVAGFIGIGFTKRQEFRPEELDLSQALAHQAMLAMELRRLSRESQQAAVMAERNRLARDIHDTLAQGLTGVIVQLEAAQDAQAQNLTKDAAAHIERASELARESLQEARRSVHALRPLLLAGKNLCVAIEALIRKTVAGTNLCAEFTIQGEPQPLPQEWEENLLRVAQEVLTNTLRHARASHFEVHFAFDQQAIRLELRDDGSGFDPAKQHDGFGLLGIKERVESMGGGLMVHSVPEKGTTTSVVLPLTKYTPLLQL
jgi:PAS domain S-box-containing protein